MTRLIRLAFGFGLLGSAAGAQQYEISTFAGTGVVPAQLVRGAGLAYPMAVTADPTGAVYVGSAFFNSVFKLDADGTITRVAGNGRKDHPGYAGDGGPATSASLFLNGVGIPSPGGLALD